VAVHIVRLGSPRGPGEGLRIGTVRRPPRGVSKADHASGNWYDVWYPDLAPSTQVVAMALADTSAKGFAAFTRAYLREMREPSRARTLDLLAALSHSADFSVGCYCADESRCHRSLLRQLLVQRGARVAEAGGAKQSR
jgi:uncharacterized protein YeaO (DUF488 family)